MTSLGYASLRAPRLADQPLRLPDAGRGWVAEGAGGLMDFARLWLAARSAAAGQPLRLHGGREILADIR
jgi:hypothetical protein